MSPLIQSEPRLLDNMMYTSQTSFIGAPKKNIKTMEQIYSETPNLRQFRRKAKNAPRRSQNTIKPHTEAAVDSVYSEQPVESTKVQTTDG